MRVTSAIAVLASGLTVVGCGSPIVKKILGPYTPYSLKINKIDERGPQRPASILISAPQIYSRERLVDDRRRERAYLIEQLTASKKIEFVSSIQRNLQSITAITAKLNLTFDPAKGAGFRRQNQLDALRFQRDQQKLKAELAELRRKAAARESTGSPSPRGADVTVNQKADAKLNELIALITRTQAMLTALAAPKENNSQATPQEIFRDRQAYRSEIRAALESAQLDDRHSANGGTLYRLQFRATILPGARKDKYAVARIKVKRPQLPPKFFSKLYLNWLGHLTKRLNTWTSSKSNSGLVPYAQLEGIAAGTGLFSIARLYYSDNPKLDGVCASPNKRLRKTNSWRNKNCNWVNLAVPPGAAKFVEMSFESNEPIKLNANSSKRICARFANRDFKYATKIIQIGQGISITIQGLVGDRGLPPHVARRAAILLKRFEIETEAARIFIREIPRNCISKKFDSSFRYIIKVSRRGRKAPMGFVGLLTSKVKFAGKNGVEKNKPNSLNPRGEIFTYATRPIELAQRISTTASAADALQLAIGISALIPGKGVAADGSYGYARSVAGKVSALERAPIVVGFSGRRSAWLKEPEKSKHPTDYDPIFGWVFGPKVVLDSRNQELRLEHKLVNHSVTADLSVPGWWPHVDLQLKTAWVGNWYGGNNQVIHDAQTSTQYLRVPLPLNRADLDGLTTILATRTVGAGIRNPQITNVRPRSVTACTSKLTFFVFGSNLWRGTVATLGGIPAKSENIKVLPDMGGVEITFDTSKWQGKFPRKDNLSLVLSAQHGSDAVNIKWNDCK